jgi:hypothetical protein
MQRLIWLALVASACADLPPLEANVCGNSVIDESEDCDSFADPDLGPNTQCAPASDTANACRSVCSQTISCPFGWGCGPEGVCR